MMEFFENMDSLLRGFWFIAIPVSLIFIFQTIMTFMGVDASDGLDADFDGDMNGGDTPFQLFSLRNLINFLLGFSWSGISFYESITNRTALIFVAFGIGLLFLFVFFLIIKQIRKLEEDSSFKYENTIGKTAEVYLTIPGNMSGKGKVMISVNGAFHELDAMTTGETISTNSMIRVLGIDNNILIVERLG